MSRTDAHVPYWVRAEWWSPMHMRCRNSTHSAMFAAQGRLRDCDLPDSPDGKRPQRSAWRAGRCYWAICWDDVPYYRRAWERGTPRWFVKHVYHDPQRARVRDVLRAAAADWRAHGDTDLEPEPIQGHNSARWLYW